VSILAIGFNITDHGDFQKPLRPNRGLRQVPEEALTVDSSGNPPATEDGFSVPLDVVVMFALSLVWVWYLSRKEAVP